LNPHGLFDLKRKWLPIFILGAAFFGAGIALGLLWLYRSSPRWVTDTVVDFLTPASPQAPPRGTLISATAALFTVVGSALLLLSIRRINASEVGNINSFWWKVAVAALAGQWWLGEPHVVVLAAGPQTSLLLRSLKPLTGRITVLGRPTPELVTALAEDEAAVARVLAALPQPLNSLSDGLRLRGRFAPPTATPLTREAVARADAVVLAPHLDASDSFGLNVDDELAEAIRRGRGKRVLVGNVSAARPESLAGARDWCAARFGPATALANGNVVQPLPVGRFYQPLSEAVLRDLADWTAPEQWDPAKLAVFLREVIGKR